MKLDIELYKLPARGWDAGNFIPHYTRLVQGLLTNLTRKLVVGTDVSSYKSVGTLYSGQAIRVQHDLNNENATLVLSGRMLVWKRIGQDLNSITVVAKLLQTNLVATNPLNQPIRAVYVEDSAMFFVGDRVSIAGQLRTVTSVAVGMIFLDDTVSFTSIGPVQLVSDKVDILVI
jgi:hypothetical protein